MSIDVNNVDVDFLQKAAQARVDVENWLRNRPNVGLDVTDVALMVEGFDYLVGLIKMLSEDAVNVYEQIKHDKGNT